MTKALVPLAADRDVKVVVKLTRGVMLYGGGGGEGGGGEGLGGGGGLGGGAYVSVTK